MKLFSRIWRNIRRPRRRWTEADWYLAFLVLLLAFSAFVCFLELRGW